MGVRLRWIPVLLVALNLGQLLAAGEGSIEEALARVSAQCPETYPELVTPVPEAGDLAGRSGEELVALLADWNPALRASVAAELASRGDAVMPLLKKELQSDRWQVRAGCADALANMVRQTMRNWKEVYPEEADGRAAQEKIRTSLTPLATAVLPLMQDTRSEVRMAALAVVGFLGVKDQTLSAAVLALCADPDEYLAQTAMILLEKSIGVEGLASETVLAALKKALHAPLPRGRGHLVRLIGRLDPAMQNALVPDLLAHLDWTPDRDTMFGAGGQAEAVQILTRLKVKALIPRLPALMDKSMRGPGLFMPVLDSAMTFGAEAKPILPQLKERLARLEKDYAAVAKATDRRGKARAESLKPKVETMRKVVAHVEK